MNRLKYFYVFIIMSQKQVISVFENRQEFLNLLKVNPGLVIVKLGATWCGPCKQIAPVVHGFFASSPNDVICADIDVDESFDLYAYFKSKKMVNGIPVILCYKKGNTTFIPDDSVTGAEPGALDAFFKRCGVHLVDVHVTNPKTTA
jgi:thioredoxin 1